MVSNILSWNITVMIPNKKQEEEVMNRKKFLVENWVRQIIATCLPARRSEVRLKTRLVKS